jgi:hypothetical protein
MTPFTLTLRSGDIHLVSPATYKQYIEPHIGNLSAWESKPAVFRLDGPAGTHASRPFMSSTLEEALQITEKLFANSTQTSIQRFAPLCHSLREAHHHLGTTHNIGVYDEVILELQPCRVNKIRQRMISQDKHHAKELDDVVNGLNIHDEAYGYDLNVSAQTLLRQLAKIGHADMDTTIQPEFEISDVNIIVVKIAVSGDEMAKAKEDPIVPAIRYWQTYMHDIMGADFSLVVDPSLTSRIPNHPLCINTLFCPPNSVEGAA